MPLDESTVISVVAPLENNLDVLPGFLAELKSVLAPAYLYYEIVLVDDGSTDGTNKVIEGLLREFEHLRYLRLSRHFGLEVAISAGLDSAIGDFVVVIDPETDPPALIPSLLARSRRSGGIVTGVAKDASRRGWLAILGATLFRAYARHYLGVQLRPGTTHYRVLSRQVVNAVTQIRDRRRNLRIFTSAVGYDLEYFEYETLQRSGSNLRKSVLEELDTAIDIIVTSSRHPLRFVSRLGLLASALNILYVGYIGVVYLVKKHVAEGWTTTSLQNTAMFFFISLILAVLCEYVGRLIEEVQHRPLYFVAHEKMSDVRLNQKINRNIVNVSTHLS